MGWIRTTRQAWVEEPRCNVGFWLVEEPRSDGLVMFCRMFILALSEWTAFFLCSVLRASDDNCLRETPQSFQGRS